MRVLASGRARVWGGEIKLEMKIFEVWLPETERRTGLVSNISLSLYSLHVRTEIMFLVAPQMTSSHYLYGP